MNVSCVTDKESYQHPGTTYHVPVDAAIRASKTIQFGLSIKVLCGVVIKRAGHFILSEYGNGGKYAICIVCLGRFVDELEHEQWFLASLAGPP